jgi:hypothetical protein
MHIERFATSLCISSAQEPRLELLVRISIRDYADDHEHDRFRYAQKIPARAHHCSAWRRDAAVPRNMRATFLVRRFGLHRVSGVTGADRLVTWKPPAFGGGRKTTTGRYPRRTTANRPEILGPRLMRLLRLNGSPLSQSSSSSGITPQLALSRCAHLGHGANRFKPASHFIAVVEHEKAIGRCVGVLASHLGKPRLAKFHDFVQVLEGKVLDLNWLSFVSMSNPLNAKHPCLSASVGSK